MRASLAAIALSLLLSALVPAASDARTSLPLGSYKGKTSDGRALSFTVVRNAKNSTYPRRITRLTLGYKIAGCKTGKISSRSFASIYFGKSKSRRGKFGRELGKHTQSAGKTGELQLDLAGRFLSSKTATGSFRVGVLGQCPIDTNASAVMFKATRLRGK